MAKFCTSCGSSLEETSKFCMKCGTPAGAPSGPAEAPGIPAGAPLPAGPPAGPAAAAPAAAKAGSPVLKVVLIVVAVLVFLGVIGIGTCVYVVYKAKQKVSGVVGTARTTLGERGTPEVQLEKGGAGSEAEAAATVDVPPYPGSTATEGGGQFSFGGKGGISSQEYETSDSVEQVLAFDKDKFGSKLHIQESEGKAIFTLTTKSALNTVTITRDADAEKTKIAIARFGK
jgi:hypothetical protein